MLLVCVALYYLHFPDNRIRSVTEMTENLEVIASSLTALCGRYLLLSWKLIISTAVLKICVRCAVRNNWNGLYLLWASLVNTNLRSLSLQLKSRARDFDIIIVGTLMFLKGVTPRCIPATEIKLIPQFRYKKMYT